MICKWTYVHAYSTRISNSMPSACSYHRLLHKYVLVWVSSAKHTTDVNTHIHAFLLWTYVATCARFIWRTSWKHTITHTHNTHTRTCMCLCRLHASNISCYRYALVWGASAKHTPQRCGKDHTLEDEDVIQIVSSLLICTCIYVCVCVCMYMCGCWHAWRSGHHSDCHEAALLFYPFIHVYMRVCMYACLKMRMPVGIVVSSPFGLRLYLQFRLCKHHMYVYTHSQYTVWVNIPSGVSRLCILSNKKVFARTSVCTWV